MTEKEDNPHYVIGQQLKSMRETSGLTQAELGKLLHISGASISLIENGTSKLNIVRLKEYIKALNGHATIVFGPRDDRRARLVDLLASTVYHLDDMQLSTLEATLKLWISIREEEEKRA